MQHTAYAEPVQGRTLELIEPGRLTFSGPKRKRPALETLLLKNSFHLEKPRPRPDGTLPRPGHGLPSYTDPITAAKAGAPNSGHAPGTMHPAELHFAIQPGDHKKAGVCKAKDCEHVGKTEKRPNPLTEHHGQPYEDDPGITFVTVEWFRPDQIHQGRFIAEGCGWTLRSVTTAGKLLVQDEPEHPSIVAMRRELDVLREALGLPPRMAGGVANSPAYAMQSGSHPAQLFRQATSLPFNPAGGVINSGDYEVTQNGTPNMTVNVAGGVPGGQILIPRTGTEYAGLYYGYNDASVNLAGFTAPSANSWISTVFAQAEDSYYGDGSTVFQLGFVTGTAASSPVAPTLAVSEMGLANITIPYTATSITTGMITSLTFPATMQLAAEKPVAGQLLAKTIYAPGSVQTYDPSTSALTVLDATNLTATITAPASGAVTVRLQAQVLIAISGPTVGQELVWGIMSGGSQIGPVVPVLSPPVAPSGASNPLGACDIDITGLTPGGSYTLEWAAFRQSSDYYVLAGDGAFTGAYTPPAVMKVYAA